MGLGISDSHSSSPVKISLLGGLTVLASLFAYQWVISSYPVGTGKVELIEQTAYIVLALVIAGVGMVSIALNDKRSFHAFILASVLYGLFFAFVSSVLVYQPLGRFSETYGVNVPSMLPVICCGQLGQMPQFVVYLTQQFAILIVPVNMILLIAVSWLVGLNVAIATSSYRNQSTIARSKWLGGLGAIVGLFGACPTCAGFFLLTMLGLAGGVAFALTLSSLQVVFLTVGVPMLLLTPITTAWNVPQGWATSCRFPSDKETVAQ